MQTLIGLARATLALIALAACDEGKPAAAPARVVAVAAQPSVANEHEFCDVSFGEAAPRFALPPVEGTVEQRAAVGRRWVNVWASWCAPCTEELPLLRRLSAELTQSGVKAALVLLSVDSNAEAVTKFAAQHPEALDSLRLSEASALEPWLKSIGLSANATLPVHLFIDERNRVTCARMGAVRESDMPSIRKLLDG